MTADLITGFGAASIALAFFLFGAYCADAVRALYWLLADRVRARRGTAPVYVPVYEDYVPVADAPAVTPAEGYEVPTARADLPAKRKPTVDHAPTGPFAAVAYTPPPPSWAQPPPSMEELRRQYDSWQETAYGQVPAPASPFPCCKHCEDGVCDTPHHVACIDCQPVYGETSVADVLAAETALPFPYDPDYDNCAGEPHGSERVFYKWYGMEQTACPRCWTNMFGGEPDPASVRTVDVLAAEDGAQLPQVIA